MYSKAKIFNLALGALLLSRQIIDAETDRSNERVILGTNWDTALFGTLQDLDLDSTMTAFTLELIEEDPNDNWLYAYKYPTNCAFFRRIRSCALMDNRTSQIKKQVAMLGTQKAIFTNEQEAVAEIIDKDIPLSSLSAAAGLCVAYRLASLSSPLVTGKGAKTLMEQIDNKYKIARAQAQAQDHMENFNFDDDIVQSEFVETRLS